jgi:prevent-host-death family protein
MTRSVTISEARASLPQIVQRVTDGEEIVITRHGRTVAVVVGPDALRVRRADGTLERAAAIADLLADGRSQGLDGIPRLSATQAEAMIDDLRAGRSGR